MKEDYRGTLIESFIEVAPYLNKLLLRDTAIAITDQEEYVAYFPGEKLDHKVKPGDKLKESSIVVRSMQNRKLEVDRIDNTDLFGVAYIGLAMPIINDEDQVIGAVFIGESTDEQDILRTMAEELTINTENVSESSQKVAARAEELSSFVQELKELSEKSYQQMEDVDQVVNFIKDISSRTNLLGLNASIEAARVGDLGNGFGVVAKEIRDLSEKSSKSVANIQDLLNGLEKSSKKIKERVISIDEVSEEQAGILEDIAASSEEINAMVEELSSLADSLSEDDC